MNWLKFQRSQEAKIGTSLGVQWLAASAGGACSIPGQVTKVPHASRPKKKKTHKKQGAKITWWLPSIKKDKTISAVEEMSLFRYKRK